MLFVETPPLLRNRLLSRKTFSYKFLINIQIEMEIGYYTNLSRKKLLFIKFFLYCYQLFYINTVVQITSLYKTIVISKAMYASNLQNESSYE
jgi:hypothetical protein